EHRELMALGGEFQQEAVVAHLPEFAQMAGHVLEVEFFGGAMSHLHGVAAAQAGGMRAHLAFEPVETLPLTAWTIDLAEQRRDLDSLRQVLPDIDINQLAVDLVLVSGEDLDRLGGLVAGDDLHNRSEHARGLAGACLAGSGSGLEDAAQTR